MTPKKKLIEVALPLEAINLASAREKSIRHGHPSTLHLWWARRPLAAARAVIFAQMVDDPSAHPDLFPTEKAQEKERQRLFRIIEDLVKWENTTNETVLTQARDEIWKSWRATCAENRDHPRAAELFDPDKLPAFHDPFAGGGSLPLEAQRLGLESYASDLNPVAVLINKAMIEIPPRFAGKPPVHPLTPTPLPEGEGPSLPSPSGRRAGDEGNWFAREWQGAQGLAEDVRYYGQWMRDEAEKRIGHLYPKIEVTAAMAEERPDLKQYVGRKLTVIAWLWARTVKSPNPAFANVDVPLASTFMLSTKAGKEAYVEPVILGARASGSHTQAGETPAHPTQAGGTPAHPTQAGGTPAHPTQAGETPAHPNYRFTVKVGKPKDAEGAKNGTKLSRGANFKCLMSGAPISGDYIKAEGKAGRMGARLMVIVAEGDRGRVYIAPTPEMEAIALTAQPMWKPETPLPDDPRNFWTVQYGLTTYGDLFTPRQLVALTTFSDLVREARERVKRDILDARASDAGVSDAEVLGARASRPHSPSGWHSGVLGARASRPHSPSGWHSRGYHPHFDHPELLQSLCFRLADSVPASLLQQWRDELGIKSNLPADDERLTALRQRIDQYEDAGHGACHLREPNIAAMVEEALLHFDGERYCLLEWCIMPNHVHVLIETRPGHVLGDVVQSWKSFTAKVANRILGRSGTFWMADYYDRYIRDEQHLAAVRSYIRENPVKANLCSEAGEWRFGSAWGERRARGPRTQDRTQDDETALVDGGSGATAYADAVGVYLGLAISRFADRNNSICTWDSGPVGTRASTGGSARTASLRNLFARQAIPMAWDYGEANPFSDSGGGYNSALEWIEPAVRSLGGIALGAASADNASIQSVTAGKVVSTDPPYYDNIGYADLSDFFYVWLRRALRPVFPDLFATMAVPKAEELVATPYRHGSKQKAETFFLDGMTQAMRRLAEQAHPAYPVTIYYAFKQSESDGGDGTTNTGWDTFLAAVIEAGFAISGTWPMRTELGNRMIGSGTNALASSIVLVCRPRPTNALTATRREFVAALKAELPAALAHLQGLGARASGPQENGLGARASGLQAGGTPAHPPGIAPVDLAQAAIGPGMAVYTRYAKVLDAEGKPLTVRAALALINQTLDEALAEQEGDFDADTRWALAWFEQMGFAEGEFGVAEQLSKAKNTAVGGLVEAGLIASGKGKVRLLKPAELPTDWDPASDPRLTVWEMVHHLVRVLEAGGEGAAAQIVARLGSKADTARELCYRLYTLCERKKRAAEAMAYNALVQSWPEIVRLAREAPRATAPGTDDLFDQE